jgi:hypothetical protein
MDKVYVRHMDLKRSVWRILIVSLVLVVLINSGFAYLVPGGIAQTQTRPIITNIEDGDHELEPGEEIYMSADRYTRGIKCYDLEPGKRIAQQLESVLNSGGVHVVQDWKGKYYTTSPEYRYKVDPVVRYVGRYQVTGWLIKGYSRTAGRSSPTRIYSRAHASSGIISHKVLSYKSKTYKPRYYYLRRTSNKKRYARLRRYNSRNFYSRSVRRTYLPRHIKFKRVLRR